MVLLWVQGSQKGRKGETEGKWRADEKMECDVLDKETRAACQWISIEFKIYSAFNYQISA